MQHHIKQQLWFSQSEQMLGNHQVTGTAYRKEFSQPLDKTQQHRLMKLNQCMRPFLRIYKSANKTILNHLPIYPFTHLPICLTSTAVVACSVVALRGVWT